MAKATHGIRLAFALVLGLVSLWPVRPLPAEATSASAQPAPPSDLQSFQLVAPGQGWALLDQRLYWTGDGGKRWTDLTPPAHDLGTIGAVTFTSSQHGWLLTTSAATTDTPSYTLFRTADGGASWDSQPLDLFAPDDPAALAGALFLEFLDTSTGWLVVKQATSSAFNLGTLFGTTDGGDTWTRLSIPAGAPVHFTTPQAGWLDTGPPEHARYATEDGGATWELQPGEAPPAPSGDLSEISLATAEAGWARSAVGECEAGACELVVQLVQTADGGQTWAPIPLPNGQPALTRAFSAPATSAAEAATQTQSGLAVTFTGHGFDSCPQVLDAAFLAKMQTWSIHSPYDVWNLYLGGASVANCGALTADVVQQLAQQGWLLIPTWVGPQAPCTTFGRRMSDDPATAYQQGVIEAHLASDRASKLGLTLTGDSGSVLYYDLEAYSTGNLGCREATQAFISGWTAALHARGSRAGVYGLCSNLIHFAGLATTPDSVWLASWRSPYFYDPNVSTMGLGCVSDSLWSQGQRLRQYTGGHNEAWGGATFNIDSDVTAGPVATVRGNCTPGSGQVALFVYANFGGQCLLRNLGDYATPAALVLPNDTISSLRLGPNVKLQVCEHELYAGVCQEFYGSDSDLSNDAVGDNRISSARVIAHIPSLAVRARLPFMRVGPLVTAAAPNGSFESGPEVWGMASARGMNVIVPANVLSAAGLSPRGGNWAVWMGGVHTETVSLAQTVSVPPDAPLLTYWHQIRSAEAGCYYDVASVWVNNSVVDAYGLCASVNTASWARQTVNLSAYAGSVVALRFQVTTDSNEISSLFLEDVGWQSGP